jgi:hypothetical protein
MAVGSVHRATNTPAIMVREIRKGESPVVTSFVGASAAASQVPAATPQITPRTCSGCPAFFRSAVRADRISSDISVETNPRKHTDTTQKLGNVDLDVRPWPFPKILLIPALRYAFTLEPRQLCVSFLQLIIVQLCRSGAQWPRPEILYHSKRASLHPIRIQRPPEVSGGALPNCRIGPTPSPELLRHPRKVKESGHRQRARDRRPSENLGVFRAT